MRLTPAPGAITFAADEPSYWFVRYRSEVTDSYPELADDVVTLAVPEQRQVYTVATLATSACK